MLENGNEISLSYKLLTKGNQWISLKTKFQISREQVNSRSNSIIAINRTICLNEIFNMNKFSSPVQEVSISNGQLNNQRNSEAETDSKLINLQGENENKKRKLDEKKNCKYFMKFFELMLHFNSKTKILYR